MRDQRRPTSEAGCGLGDTDSLISRQHSEAMSNDACGCDSCGFSSIEGSYLNMSSSHFHTHAHAHTHPRTHSRHGSVGGGGGVCAMEMEGEEDKHTSFRVLCVQLSNHSRTFQMAFCTAGVVMFFLVYGYLQEYIMIHLFDRRFGMFLTLLQFFTYALMAFVSQLPHKDGLGQKIPLPWYIALGLLQATTQGLSNLSMRWLNYTAKLLFKSSRIVPTMAVGLLVLKRRYRVQEYIIAALVSLGLVLFVVADAKVSPAFHPYGVMCMCVALSVDAVTINAQEYILRRYRASHEELVLYSYSLGAVGLLFANIASTELYEGATFLMSSGRVATAIVTGYCMAGYFGVSCMTAMTKHFGALPATITTTARKAISLILSFVFFPKPVTPLHVLGGALLVSGLGWQTLF